MKKIHLQHFCIFQAERGVFIPSSKLSLIFDVTIATAQKALKKVAHVLKENMRFELPQIDTSKFIDLFVRRSTETPARLHPKHEQFVVEQEASDAKEDAKQNQATESSSAGAARSDDGSGPSLLDFIGNEPISFDGLMRLSGRGASELGALLTLFELEGLVKRLPGDSFVRFATPTEEELFLLRMQRATASNRNESEGDDTVGSLQYIQSQFGGCSRKYLDLFLSMYWCVRDRARWSQGEVMTACLNYGYVSYKEIYSAVTPPKTYYCPL